MLSTSFTALLHKRKTPKDNPVYSFYISGIKAANVIFSTNTRSVNNYVHRITKHHISNNNCLQRFFPNPRNKFIRQTGLTTTRE
ncbi:MAG: hypothetical protein K0B81_01125 [Candidatus Cloacimonetes bacterium]|nr:hypothetical protein [Candidatus Cloacimonadota bacterium]